MCKFMLSVNELFVSASCSAMGICLVRCLQEHKKQAANEKEEASVFKAAVHAQGRAGRPEPPGRKKRDNHREDVLAGKRLLDLNIARALAPPGAYIYDTTDGLRVRVFYGKRRRSTSFMIQIGKALAIKHCLTWAWTEHQKDVGGSQCPFDLSKIKVVRREVSSCKS